MSARSSDGLIWRRPFQLIADSQAAKTTRRYAFIAPPYSEENIRVSEMEWERVSEQKEGARVSEQMEWERESQNNRNITIFKPEENKDDGKRA